MNLKSRSAERRAAALLRWYPHEWRDRYQGEFLEILVDDIAERPQSSRRTLDVAFHGIMARLSLAGLRSRESCPGANLRSGLTTSAGMTTAFLVFGTAVWAHLTTAWQWRPPDNPATAGAMVLMSASAFALLALLAIGACPVVWSVLRAAVRRPSQRLLVSIAITAACAAVLVLGGRSIAPGWPGTGGHAWLGRGIVPAGVASFCWAVTLWISSYWAHPGALKAFPAREIAWMVVSLIATIGLVAGAISMVRAADLSARTMRFEIRLDRAATIAMLPFLAGAFSWILAGATGPKALFHTGLIDVLSLAVMSMAAIAAWRVAKNRTADVLTEA